MVEITELKKINLLSDMPDDILDKIGAIAQLDVFDEESILFRQNQKQTLLYMVVSGKVFLTSRSDSGKTLTLDEIGKGRTFGISSIMGDASSTFTAVCAEKCAIITISGEQLHQLFEDDYRTGHLLMLQVVQSFKRRTLMHTRQFLKSLATHPEINI